MPIKTGPSTSREDAILEYQIVNRVINQLEANVREHRAHLEHLVDRTVKVIYVILVVAVGALGFFGVKTVGDVREIARRSAESRVDSVITRDFVTVAVQQRINQYSRAALVKFLLIRSADPENETELSNDDLGVLREVLQDPENEAFLDSLRVLRRYTIIDRTFRYDIGSRLTQLLDAGWSRKNLLPPDHQAEVLKTIAHLRYQPAIADLMPRLNDTGVAMAVRLLTVDTITELADDETKSDVATALASNFSKLRPDGGDLYRTVVGRVMRLRPDIGLAELSALATAQDERSRLALASVVPATFDIAMSEDDTPSFTALLAHLWQDDRIRLQYLGQFRLPPADGPQLVLSVVSRSGHSTGRTLPGDVFRNRNFQESVVEGYRSAPAAKRMSYATRVLGPIVALLSSEIEKTGSGVPGMFVKLSSDKATLWQIVKVDATVVWLRGSGQAASQTKVVSARNLDAETLQWITLPERKA